MKIFLAIVGTIIAPLIISLLLKAPIFSFASGNVESWISFWGSYVGALIGAVTVYFVTNSQVKQQLKMQLHTIDSEHRNALERELKQFHFKNEIEKVEEFYDLLEDILDLISKCANDFTTYITYTHILYGGQDKYTKDEEQMYKDKVKALHSEVYNYIHTFTKTVLKMQRLSAYIDDTTTHVTDISEQIKELIIELRSGYNDKYSYKKYPNFNVAPLDRHLLAFTEKIMNLKNRVLQPKLHEKIEEMKRYSNL